MDNTGEIDVESIMRRVKESMDRKKSVSSLMSGNVSQTRAPPATVTSNIKSDYDYLHDNWNTAYNTYRITSHRKLVGPIMITGRQLINGEIKRYVDPMLARQAEFNASILRYIDGSLSGMEWRFNSLSEDMEKKLTVIEKESIALNEKTNERNDAMAGEYRDNINGLRSDVDKKFESINREIIADVSGEINSMIAAMDQDIEKKAWLASMLEGRAKESKEIKLLPYPKINSAIDYLDFENRFRGSREDIRQRQSAFIDCYRGRTNVLDIGSGRGEFLELMRDIGVVARGIDIDESMVQYCLSMGLDVQKSDAITYLESLDDESLDGVFCDQVVEHLEPDYLVLMLNLCNRKMKAGSHIFLETVNPTSFTSFVNFLIDMTHRQPIHPETLAYITRAAGFKDIEVKFLAPVSDNLKKIEISGSMSDSERETLTTYNDNIDRLNRILFGAQDYYITGKK